eukprot:SAG11_NODE_992_length_6262_cov_2.097193_2_plen_313_part_00
MASPRSPAAPSADGRPTHALEARAVVGQSDRAAEFSSQAARPRSRPASHELRPRPQHRVGQVVGGPDRDAPGQAAVVCQAAVEPRSQPLGQRPALTMRLRTSHQLAPSAAQRASRRADRRARRRRPSQRRRSCGWHTARRAAVARAAQRRRTARPPPCSASRSPPAAAAAGSPPTRRPPPRWGRRSARRRPRTARAAPRQPCPRGSWGRGALDEAERVSEWFREVGAAAGKYSVGYLRGCRLRRRSMLHLRRRRPHSGHSRMGTSPHGFHSLGSSCRGPPASSQQACPRSRLRAQHDESLHRAAHVARARPA